MLRITRTVTHDQKTILGDSNCQSITPLVNRPSVLTSEAGKWHRRTANITYKQ